jgi:Flp pilus assembly protein TadG
MVEFALILPILLLVICGIIDLGWIFGNQLMASSASRDAARYTAIHYNDSAADDDRAIAASLISSRAPTLKSPVVTLTKSDADSSITLSVSSNVEVITPLLSGLFSGGVYRVNTQVTMRLE